MVSSAARSKGSKRTSEPAPQAARTGSRLRRSRAERINLAPARAKARARDRPMPEEAPVIHTTFLTKGSRAIQGFLRHRPIPRPRLRSRRGEVDPLGSRTTEPRARASGLRGGFRGPLAPLRPGRARHHSTACRGSVELVGPRRLYGAQRRGRAARADGGYAAASRSADHGDQLFRPRGAHEGPAAIDVAAPIRVFCGSEQPLRKIRRPPALGLLGGEARLARLFRIPAR